MRGRSLIVREGIGRIRRELPPFWWYRWRTSTRSRWPSRWKPSIVNLAPIATGRFRVRSRAGGARRAAVRCPTLAAFCPPARRGLAPSEFFTPQRPRSRPTPPALQRTSPWAKRYRRSPCFTTAPARAASATGHNMNSGRVRPANGSAGSTLPARTSGCVRSASIRIGR